MVGFVVCCAVIITERRGFHDRIPNRDVLSWVRLDGEPIHRFPMRRVVFSIARESCPLCHIRIGEIEGERLTLTLASRELSDATDFWDGNWLSCTAEVASGAFRGRLEGWIRTDELVDFHRQVEVLYERLTGEAVFETMEMQLSIRLVGDGRGHIEAHSTFRDNLMFGNRLDCTFSFDQTSLRLTARDLATALLAYPIVGR